MHAGSFGSQLGIFAGGRRSRGQYDEAFKADNGPWQLGGIPTLYQHSLLVSHTPEWLIGWKSEKKNDSCICHWEAIGQGSNQGGPCGARQWNEMTALAIQTLCQLQQELFTFGIWYFV